MKIRQAERTAFCRGCDKKIEPKTDMLSMYSYRNRGQNIHFCLDCVEKMHEMLQEHRKENNELI